jgi:hypothetical protein
MAGADNAATGRARLGVTLLVAASLAAGAAPAAAVGPSGPGTELFESPGGELWARTASSQGTVRLISRAQTAFEANRGQLADGVRFAARGAGFGLALTDRAATLAVPGEGRTHVVRMDFAGAPASARARSGRRLPGTANYLRGDAPREWRQGVPTYESVLYRSLWPGVDLVFHGRRGQLEYDLLLAPGADVSRARFSFAGQRDISLDRDGALVLAVPGGAVRHAAPRSFQVVGGRRRPVESSWVLLGRGEVGLELGRYDRSRPLVIDPTLAYSSYLGGSGDEFSYGIARDGGGSVYLTGITSSTDFPVTPGAHDTSQAGGEFNGYDVFVAKLSADGSQRLYATYLGGTNDDEGSDIAVDGAGSAYVTGVTFSTDFPTTPGVLKPSFTPSGSSGNAFVTKLSPNGSSLAYSTYLGGQATLAGGVAVDPSGNAYVTGNTIGADFPVTAGAAQPTYAGSPGGFNSNAFVAKLNPSASALVYGTYLGGGTGPGPTINTHGASIALDSSRNAYVSGKTNTDNFPTTAGALQPGRTRAENGFVTKVNPGGTAFSFSSYLPQDSGDDIAVDGADRSYVTGEDGAQAYAAKVNSNASGLVYARVLGPGSGAGIAVDGAGRAVVTGRAPAGFGTTPDALQPSYGGGFADAFAVRLDPGGATAYSSYLGGSGFDGGRAVATDEAENAYITGDTDSANFPTRGAVQPARAGGSDAFVTKLSLAAPVLPPPDADRDGVPDSRDACPTVAGTPPSGCPPLPRPVLGRTVNVIPVRGRVFVSLPPRRARASASVPGLKGRRFVPLTTARQIPVRSLLDTRRGTVRLISASTRGRTQTSDFLAGVFQVLQSRRTSAKGLTELRLKGSSFRRCRRGHASAADVVRARHLRRTIRRLRGNGRGRFRTRGRYSAATVRGTDWTVSDRCDGTLTRVRRGRVAVRDLRRRRTIVLRAGKRYLARARAR